jgi:hypothetical protein
VLAHSAQRRRWASSLLTAAALFICGGALSAQTAGSDYTVKAGDTLSGIAQAAYGDMTLWGGVWEANKAKLPSAANPHNLPAGTVLSLPRFDTEAAKTSARNARHAAPAFTGSGSGAAAANARPVAYSNDYGRFEYLPVAFTQKQLDALPSTNNGKTYGGTDGWTITVPWELFQHIIGNHPEMLKYALHLGYDRDFAGTAFYEEGMPTTQPKLEKRYLLIRQIEAAG